MTCCIGVLVGWILKLKPGCSFWTQSGFFCVSGSGGPLLFDDLPPAGSGDPGRQTDSKVWMEIIFPLLLCKLYPQVLAGF